MSVNALLMSSLAERFLIIAMRNNNTRMISDPCLTIPTDARGSHAYLSENDSIDSVRLALDFAGLRN